MSIISLLRCNGQLPALEGTSFLKPPQVASTSAPLVSRWHLSVPHIRLPWTAVASVSERPRRGVHSIDNTRYGTGARGSVATTAVGTSYGRDAPAPYKWSWQDDSEPPNPLDLDASAITTANSIQELTVTLRAAVSAAHPGSILTPPSRSLLAATVQRLLPHDVTTSACSVLDVARLLEVYVAVSHEVSGADVADACDNMPPRLVASVLAHVCSLSAVPGSAAGRAAAAAVHSTSARDLADLLWVLSELPDNELPWESRTVATATAAAAAVAGAGPATLEAVVTAEAPGVLQRAVLARVRDQDFLAPDLCRVVCALGGLAADSTAAAAVRSVGPSSPPSEAPAVPRSGGGGFTVDPELVRALGDEIRYQLTEFDADFDAADLGRLISGMAGLWLGPAVAGDEEYRRILMKAVYGKTRSIVDKAAVDFALSRLLLDDPEARSMHYDSRWTHEELRWLPRRERDKRRILKEGWYRTKWGGWSPGGDGGA